MQSKPFLNTLNTYLERLTNRRLLIVPLPLKKEGGNAV